MNTIRSTIIFLTLSFFSIKGNAQVHHHPINRLPFIEGYPGQPSLSIEERTQKSETIVEGAVIHVNSFFDSKENVFSSCLVRLSKVFKGDIKDSVIEIVTEGGVVPSGPNKGDMTVADDNYSNFPYGEGLFFLMPNNTEIQSGKGYQSFIITSARNYQRTGGYNDFHPVTTDRSKLIYDLTTDLYPLITAATHQPYTVLGTISFDTIMTNTIDPATYKGNIPLSDKIPSRMHISMEDRVNKSDLIVEGEVINTHVFVLKKTPFTSAIIKVSKILKGEIKDTVIEVITDGVVMPNGAKLPSQWGFLLKGQFGIFFLRVNNSTIQSGENIQSYFFLYDYSFRIYNYLGKSFDYETNIYKPIEAITGTPAKVIGLNSYEAAAKSQQK